MSIGSIKRKYRQSTFWNSKEPEYIVMLLFIVSYCTITAFHEPWFDEAQSWQIAKCASLSEMMFEIPHYEGHPPLWWLILAIPAKIGIPFELGLKAIGFFISASSVALIIFKLPYPRWIRLILPFSYFIFYQYGIIVRPYGLMLLCFLLLVPAFPQRGRHPWRFVMLLIFLCLTSAYGIVMAGGIAACVTWELLREKGIKGFVFSIFKDSRILSLGALLVVAVFLVLAIMPRSDTLVTSKNATNSIPLCLTCALFTFISECTITTSSWFSVDSALLQHARIPMQEFVSMCIIGCLLWVMIIGASSKMHLKYFLVPYGLLSVFASVVYFGVHHVGIVFLLLLFWLGTLFQDNKRFEIGRAVLDRLSKTARDRKLLKKTAFGVVGISLIIPIYWSIYASALDVQLEYSYGRYAASFINTHDLEDCLIFSSWGMLGSTDESNEEDNKLSNTSYVGSSVLINAYFDHNICMNLNCGNNREAYMKYRIASEEEDKETIEEWRRIGVPDLIIGKTLIEQVFPNVSYDNYTLVDAFPINYVWKSSRSEMVLPVYARNDILEKFGLQTINDQRIQYWINGFTLTDEIQEQIKNGVPAEEVLKPYLDAMFGEQK